MNITTLADIARLLNQHGLSSIEYAQAEESIRLIASTPADVPPAPVPPPAETRRLIVSPGMGVLRLARQDHGGIPRSGQRVCPGQTLGYLEVGVLRTEVTADVEGILLDVLASEAEVVGFAQPLFHIE